MSYFNQNLKSERVRRGLTQAEMADNIGVKRSTYATYEKDAEPEYKDLIAISEFLGISVDNLLKSNISTWYDAQGNLIPEQQPAGKEVNRNLNSNRIGNLSVIKEDVPAENWELAEPESKPILAPKKGAIQRVQMPRVITVDTTGDENAVLVPIRARAGYLTGYADPKFIEKLPAFKIWGSAGRTYRIFEVDGNSMFNTLHDRDKVKSYWISISDVRDGRIYVIMTKNDGILIKRVINRYQEGKLILKSDNNHRGEYPPIIIDVHEVLEIWEVEENSTRMLGEPGEWYQRMLNLEADVVLLKQKLLKGD